MNNKHPYVTSPGGLIQAIKSLRNSFPNLLTADTLKKLGFAPKNETYIVNTIRFLGFIDEDGNKTEIASKIFTLHADNDFHREFSKVVMNCYKELFALYGDKAWDTDEEHLITFFRQNDQSGIIVGTMQAKTFSTLCGLSGKGSLPDVRGSNKATVSKKQNNKTKNFTTVDKNQSSLQKENIDRSKTHDIGLTVRIEINLPAEGTKETYDSIFKSIKENLLNG